MIAMTGPLPRRIRRARKRAGGRVRPAEECTGSIYPHHRSSSIRNISNTQYRAGRNRDINGGA